MPGIDDLAQELDFRVTLVHQPPGLGQDLVARTASLRAARHGHNTERAALVAPFNDGEISPERVIAAGHLGLKALLRVERETGYAPVSGFELVKQLRQFRIARGAADQTDLRRALKKPLAFLLRHAAQHSNHFPRAASALAESPEPRKDLLRGLFPDAAGVVKHKVSLIVVFDGRHPTRHQHALHLLRIVHVHLAAEGFNVKGLQPARRGHGVARCGALAGASAPADSKTVSWTSSFPIQQRRPELSIA